MTAPTPVRALPRSEPTDHPVESVIVGYGHAGRDLHHRILIALAGRGAVPRGEALVVDPVRPVDPLPGSRWLSSLPQALAALGSPASAVVHVATPVRDRARTIRDLAAAGIRRVIMEKPFAESPAAARELTDLIRDCGVDVLPVAVWPSSTITRRVVELLAAGRIGRPVSLHVEQSKPRFRRSFENSAHSSAFEVELPHQMLLALHLFGDAESVEAVSWPLRNPAGQDRMLGGATVCLRHRDGLVTTLTSDLTSPVRIRRLRLRGTEGEIVAHYPIGGDDPFGQIQVTGERDRTLLPDAPLTTFVEDCYRYFTGSEERPAGTDLRLHARVTELLAAASAAAVPGDAPSLLGRPDSHAFEE
ncbi:Gfo/Idh/MocA family oxidoreductase [Streptomyces sp. NPDC005576]|uniref:Gfo/Idh/MocA family oxidoreductase n=1 Tax=Streptomyces sp. NPDC005576 TaxID=3364726 RepID=UPI003682485F